MEATNRFSRGREGVPGWEAEGTKEWREAEVLEKGT